MGRIAGAHFGDKARSYDLTGLRECRERLLSRGREMNRRVVESPTTVIESLGADNSH